MGHKSGNTSRVSKTSLDWLNHTGFPGDMRVAFFNVLPGNTNALTPNPLTKEESCHVYNCDNECLSGSTKPSACTSGKQKSSWSVNMDHICKHTAIDHAVS